VLHAGTEAALAGLTSLEQAGLTGWFRRPIHVVVPRGVSVSPIPGLVVHSTRYQGERPWGAGEACPATPPARSAVDAARWLRSPRATMGLVMAVVQQRLATPAQLYAVVDRLGSFPQRSLVVDAIEASRGGSDSLAEADVVRICTRLGLTNVRQQMVIDTPDGPRRVDLVVDLPDGQRLVIEVDGPHHADPDMRQADAVKDAALIAAGYLVLRVPVLAIRRGPTAVLRQLAAIRDAALGGSRTPPV
jgi:very-short-patch-repair endonuclease